MTIQEAKARAQLEMGRHVKPLGLEVREVGPHVITVFYYSYEYDEIGTYYRADVYEDDTKTAGLAFG